MSASTSATSPHSLPIQIQTQLHSCSARQGARHCHTQEQAHPAWRGQRVAPSRQSQSTGCVHPLRRVGPWRPGWGEQFMLTAHLSCLPAHCSRRAGSEQTSHRTSSNFILGFIFGVRALRAPLHHFSYESWKMSAAGTQLDSCRARYIPLLPKPTSCHACLLGEHPRSQQGSPVPGEGQRSAGGRSRHSSRQGGFFLHRFFHAASEACAQSWRALLHPGTPLSP